jgi:hypothetical protein
LANSGCSQVEPKPCPDIKGLIIEPPKRLNIDIEFDEFGDLNISESQKLFKFAKRQSMEIDFVSGNIKRQTEAIREISLPP